MRQKILIGLALVLALLGGLYLYFAQPDEARLSIAAVGTGGDTLSYSLQ